MATHGSLRVEGRNENFIHLHTTHDGHTGNLEDCVLHLPHFLFASMKIEGHRRIRFFSRFNDVPSPPLSEEEEVEVEEMFYEDLKYDNVACMCDQQSLSSYLISYHQDYLMPIPKTSDMLDYWDYGNTDVVTVYAYPDENYYKLDSTPIWKVYEEEEDEMMERLEERVDEMNDRLDDEYYRMQEDGTVIVPMKEVISRLFCLNYQDELFVPETLYLRNRYKNTFDL